MNFTECEIMVSAASLPYSLSINLAATSTPTASRSHPHSNIKFLSRSGKLDDAIRLVESKATELDVDTCSILLHACISRRALEHGRRLHLRLLLSGGGGDKSSLLNNPTLVGKLITLYSVCGRIDEARLVFDEGLTMPESVWVAMAIGYSRNGYSKEALVLFCGMLNRFCGLGHFAFSMALKACINLSNLEIGKEIHAQIVKSDAEPDQVVHNALLRLYTECGSFDDALKVFDEMPARNVVSWNSLISSFVSRENIYDSFKAFRVMQKEGINFSWITLTTILPICSLVTSLHIGKEIHGQILKSRRKPDIPVINSLMDMYAKCGAMDYCKRVFDKMLLKDLTSWNTLLAGYGMNGCMEEAMELFDQMVESGLRPDEITFISLLSGCSHGGFPEIGQKLFRTMTTDYEISPCVEHYACVVDMLGRSGRIKEAMEIVRNMPMKPSGSIFGSLLNSCQIYGDVDSAKKVVKELFELEPDNGGNYVILSNIYANARMYDEVRKVRKMMEGRGVKKEVGCSWVQIPGRIHSFVAGGGVQFRDSAEFKRVWNELVKGLEEIGYVSDTSSVLHDVDDETKAMMLCSHSERLAVMYGLINSGSGIPIRITKNLRVCRDCHCWVKHVSKITERVIVLRDTNRFHHFKEGSCSCKDFW